MSIVVLLNNGKIINTKVSHNGKFQITGCKEDSHFIDCVKYICQAMIKSEEYTGEKIYKIKSPRDPNEKPAEPVVKKRKEKKRKYAANLSAKEVEPVVVLNKCCYCTEDIQISKLGNYVRSEAPGMFSCCGRHYHTGCMVFTNRDEDRMLTSCSQCNPDSLPPISESLILPKEVGNIIVIFNTVMKNIDFKVGFFIQRDKLDCYINQHTDFRSLFEGSISTGVNIKIRADRPFDPLLIKTELVPRPSSLEGNDPEGNEPVGDYLTVDRTMVPYDEYFRLLDEKDQIKEKKKKRYFTLLVFHSGSCILSGVGPDMEKVYNILMDIIIGKRSFFEEKLLDREEMIAKYEDKVNELRRQLAMRQC